MRAARSGAPERRLGRFEENTKTSFGRARNADVSRDFSPASAEKSREKVQHTTDRVTKTEFCGSDAPTVREPFFFLRAPKISVSPAGAEPPDAQPSTHSSVRAQGTPRCCPSARASPFSRASPSHALRRPRRGLNRESRADPTFRAPLSLLDSRTQPLYPSNGVRRRRERPRRPGGHAEHGTRESVFLRSGARRRDTETRRAVTRVHPAGPRVVGEFAKWRARKAKWRRFAKTFRTRNHRVRLSGVLSARRVAEVSPRFASFPTF